MATVSFSTIAAARSFPLPSASRSLPMAGATFAVPVRLYTTTTLSTFRSRLSALLIDNFWTDTELNTIINEALRIWNTVTGYFRAKATIAIPPGDPAYPVNTMIDTNCFAVLRTVLGGSVQTPLSLKELGALKHQYESDTASTPTSYIPLGLSRISLYPTTTATTNGYVEFIRFAILPTSDSDYLQVGEEDLDAILSLCRFLAALKEGGAEIQSANPHLKHFLDQAAEYNSKVKQSALYRTALGMAAGGQKDITPDSFNSKGPR